MARDEAARIAEALEREDWWKELFQSIDSTHNIDPKSTIRKPLDWYSIGKEAGENGVDSKAVQSAVEGYYKVVSIVDKARRGRASAHAQKEKERWSELNLSALLAEEQGEVKRLREEADEKNPKSPISGLLKQVGSLDSQLKAYEARLEAIGREEAVAAIKNEAALSNGAYLRRLKRVICITAAGDAAITIFLTSDYLVVGSFDTLVDAYGQGNWAELIIRSAGLLLLSCIPYVLSIAIKSMADHDKSGMVRKKIEWTSVILGGLFFGGAALSYLFDALSKPPLGWSMLTAVSTLFSTMSIFGLTTGLVVVGGLAAHYYFAGTQQAKLAQGESKAVIRKLLGQREQTGRRQDEAREKRNKLIAEIQKKRGDLSDAVRKLAEARARLESERSAAHVDAASGPSMWDVEGAQTGAASMALLGWLVGISSRAKNVTASAPITDYDRKRSFVERKLASRNGHK